jgi:hypothetical protein
LFPGFGISLDTAVAILVLLTPGQDTPVRGNFLCVLLGSFRRLDGTNTDSGILYNSRHLFASGYVIFERIPGLREKPAGGKLCNIEQFSRWRFG